MATVMLYGAMQDMYWVGSKVVQINEDRGPSDAAIETALEVYANHVIDTKETHFLKPYLQVEDGYVWWFAQAVDVLSPESWVLKRAVMRDYMLRAELERLDYTEWEVRPDDQIESGPWDLGPTLAEEIEADLDEDDESGLFLTTEAIEEPE